MRALILVVICLPLFVGCETSPATKPFGFGGVQTTSPLPLATARKLCNLPFPDTATNIQFAGYGAMGAHEYYVRFDAPAQDCLKTARIVLQDELDTFQKAGEFKQLKIVSESITDPPPKPDSSRFDYLVDSPQKLDSNQIEMIKALATPAWFDLENYQGGVAFRLSNNSGAVVYVDVKRQCFYFYDSD